MHEQGKTSLKHQLEKKVRAQCDDMGAAAAEQVDELVSGMASEFDKKIASGMAEIDAYKEMLRDMDRIEEMLRDLPKTENETDEKADRVSRKEWNRKLSAIEGKLNGILWLLTVILYFGVSFLFGYWHLTWLIFLSSSIVSIIIDMLFSYNKGVPKKKVFGKIHGIMWLSIVIAYFMISFATGAWHITWLIYILGALIETIAGFVGKIME